MRALLALVAWAGVSLGCGDDDPRPLPDVDAGRDAATDASLDASPPLDAAADAPSDVPGDTCANPIDVRASLEPAEDGAYHISGNLDDFADDMDSCGLPNFDGDAVYVYVPPAGGQLRTTLGDDSWADLALRSTCDDPKSQLSCIGYPGFGCAAEPCGHVDPVSAGTPVYLVVDGKYTTARAYELTLQHYPWVVEGGTCADDDLARTCTPPLRCREEEDGERRCRAMICGDGIAEGDLLHEAGEECDDGNEVSGDGCSATCSFDEQGPGGEDCPSAAPFRLVPTNRDLLAADYGIAASDTSAASADLAASCTSSATSPDEVWRLEVSGDAIPLTIAASPSTDGYLPVLYVLAGDGGGDCSATEVGCGVAAPGQGVTLTFDALEPGTYYVVVDGLDGEWVSSGAYRLEALASVF